MCNELIFIFHSLTVSLLAVLALRGGLVALAGLAGLYAILANLLVLKQVTLLGLCVTSTDAYSVGSSLALNLIQEYFGPKAARQSLYLTLAGLGVFVLLAQFQLWYLPALLDNCHPAYQLILAQTPRLLGASLVSFAISQALDRKLYSYLQTKLAPQFTVQAQLNRPLNSSGGFIVRNYGALLISQLVDTALFTVLGLAGTLPNLGEIFIFSYLIKVLAILLTVPVVSACKSAVAAGFTSDQLACLRAMAGQASTRKPR